MNEDTRRPRWGWVVACLVLGAVLVGLALLLEDRWAWQGTMPSVLVNVGTTISLAGVLVLLEPLFTGRVIRASRQAVQQVAAEVEGHLQRRADELSARIDQLQGQVNQRMEARAQAQDSLVDGLGAPTFTTVTEALAEANRLGALVDGVATVEASSDPAGLGLDFLWGNYLGRGFDPPDQAGLRLDVEARLLLSAGGQPVVKVEWKPDEPLDEFAERMSAELMRAGMWNGRDTMNWTQALQNLQNSLRLAITSRRRDETPWQLRAPLFEMVGSDWALTEAGLESRRTNDVLIPEKDFPSKGLPGQGTPIKDWSPPQPDWISLNEWTVVLQRAKRRFPRLASLHVFPMSWVPYTGTETAAPTIT